MSDTKRPRGRPKKAQSDRMAQFSVRMPAFAKVGLMMLARNRGVSYSQAVEFAVRQAIATETLPGGETIQERLLLMTGAPETSEMSVLTAEAERGAAEFAANIAAFLRALPAELITPADRFFLRCVELVGEDNAKSSYLYDLAVKGFHQGAAPESVALAFQSTR